MNKRLHSIVRSELMRNSAKLLSANIVAQAIGLLVYPILTRIYAPEDFGLLNLFLSIGGVLVLFATAEYQYAIVLPKEEEKAQALVHVCGMWLITISGVVLLSVAFSQPIGKLFGAPTLSKWYWMMPLYVLIMGTWTIFNYWYIRHKQFGAISKYQLSQSTLSAATKVGCGGMGWIGGGLLVGSVFAPLVSLVINAGWHWKRAIRTVFVSVGKGQCKEVAREYRNFPMYSLPRAVVNTLGGNLPALMLTPFFGLGEVGFIGMAITLAFRPVNMVCSSLYQVLFQRISMAVNGRNSIWRFLTRYLVRIGGATIVVFTILYFVLPPIVVFLLGAEWKITGTYIQIMLPWLLMVTLVSTTNYLPDVFGKQKGYMIFELVYVIGRILGLAIGIIHRSMLLAVSLFSMVSCVILIIEFIWFSYIVRQYEKSIS